MKKNVILFVAAIVLASCMEEQVMEIPQRNAIAFGSVFIENATRAAEDPSTQNGKLTAFDVWGFVKEYDGTVFDDQDVILEDGLWTYYGTQYWVPEQEYYFSALAPMNSRNIAHQLASGEAAKLGLGTVTFTNEDGTEDLLYAHDSMFSNGVGETADPIQFQFKHLLSKLKFTFKNGFVTENASIQVRNIRITAPAEGSIDVVQTDYSNGWVLEDEKVTLEFGDVEKLAYGNNAESAFERLTIPAPASYVYLITFDVDLYMGVQLVYTTSMESTVTGVGLEIGKAYNFTADITPESLELDNIAFDVVRVDSWTPMQ